MSQLLRRFISKSFVYKIVSIPSSIDGCLVNVPECDVFPHCRLVNSAPVDNLHRQVTAQVDSEADIPPHEVNCQRGYSEHFIETPQNDTQVYWVLP